MLSSVLLVFSAVPLTFPLARASSDDWAAFLGPNRNNAAALEGVAFDWARRGPKELWRAPIGPGFGGAAVAGGEVFLFDRVDDERDLLRVFALESGEELWSAGYEAPGRLNFGGSRSVPAVEDGAVWATGGFGQVTCFDRAARRIRWQVDMAEVYGGIEPMFGWSASPLVVDDLVVVTPLGEEVGLLALDKRTGEEAWVTEPVGFSHSTPALLELGGKPQILFLATSYQTSGEDRASPTTVWSFDPRSGATLWRTDVLLTRLPIPPPVKIDDERIFLTGGYRGGSTLLRVREEGGAWSFEELFRIERGAQVHPPLLHEGHLYVLVNENWNDGRARRKEGGLLCLTLEGRELWRTGDAPFFGRGNALLAGGHLIVQDGHSGVLRVVRATPEGYREVAAAAVFGEERGGDGQMWAPMALAGRRLLARSQEELVCLELASN